MDAVSEVLADVRARGAVFRRAIIQPPWALRMASGVPLTLATMLHGSAWILPEHQEPVRIQVGDIAIVRGDTPYVVADSPTTAPTQVVTSADFCTTNEDTGVCGEPAEEPSVLVSGAFENWGELSERLLHTLPAVLVVPADDLPAASVRMLDEEVSRARPGQQLVLDRLLDLLLVSALRSWFETASAAVPAWCQALDDPIAGAGLRLLHDNPTHPWTVAELATKVGVSRAAFARRFTALIGEPPMSYLTGWRVALAADLLRKTDHTVDSIARKVGYANAFALSVAFKRLRGTRPSEYRNANHDSPSL